MTRTIALLLLSTAAWAADSESMEDARRWAAAKFLHAPDTRPAPAHLLAAPKPSLILKDRIQGHKFLIVDREFERGLAMRTPGEIAVYLPGPARRLEAVVGVDSNDVGYYAHAGRGNVVASVELNGRTLFRSAVLHEGTPGVPVSVDLNGAAGFRLKLESVGRKSFTYQDEWDQADWADARVLLADGRTIYLSDLRSGPLPKPFHTGAPFSFRYGGRDSREFLDTWRFESSTRKLDAHRTEQVASYTDPATGLVARCGAISYDDFPALEWTLYLKNSGREDTPMIESIEGVDIALERGGEGEFTLHHARGSFNSALDFEPLDELLAPGAGKVIRTTGGRPTDTDLGYFNVEWPGQGVIVALGWPGQWAATFTRDKEASLQVKAGQENTHFRLHPASRCAVHWWCSSSGAEIAGMARTHGAAG